MQGCQWYPFVGNSTERGYSYLNREETERFQSDFWSLNYTRTARSYSRNWTGACQLERDNSFNTLHCTHRYGLTLLDTHLQNPFLPANKKKKHNCLTPSAPASKLSTLVSFVAQHLKRYFVSPEYILKLDAFWKHTFNYVKKKQQQQQQKAGWWKTNTREECLDWRSSRRIWKLSIISQWEIHE